MGDFLFWGAFDFASQYQPLSQPVELSSLARLSLVLEKRYRRHPPAGTSHYKAISAQARLDLTWLWLGLACPGAEFSNTFYPK